MATDWQDYAEQMLTVLQQYPQLRNTSASNDYIPRPDFRPLTKFEQRGQRLGHGVWDLYFIKP
jgi:tRNA (guanine-N(7)-)-methyltransferase